MGGREQSREVLTFGFVADGLALPSSFPVLLSEYSMRVVFLWRCFVVVLGVYHTGIPRSGPWLF